MKMVANRDITIIGRDGNAISFTKDEAKHVPDAMVNLCMEKGIMPADPKQLPNNDPKNAPPAPTGAARVAAIREAFELLVSENTREKFTGAGAPRVDAMRSLLGFEIDGREVNEQWDAFRAGE